MNAEKNEALRKVCDKWWANLKTNKGGKEVLWEVINRERNYMFKEYETGAEWFVDIYEVVDTEGNNIVTESGYDVTSTNVNLRMVSLTNGIKTAGDEPLTV